MEIWKEIPGYEGIYEASNLGRIKGVDRQRHGWRGQQFVAGVIRTQRYFKGGKSKYMYVTLCNKGVKRSEKVHRLVASAFLPNPDKKPQVHHIDFDPTNNKVENLMWVTHKENSGFSRHQWRGERNNQVRLQVADVIDIKRSRGIIGPKALSEKFKVDRHTIHDIWNGKNWGWVVVPKAETA